MLKWQSFCCPLPSRALLRLAGNESHDFLQGLFTNDLRLLHSGGSMWGCFLFYTGRVFCDAYLYQSHHGNYNGHKESHEVEKNINHNKENSSVYIDIHVEYANKLLDYLTEMKMRKKITIDNITDTHNVFAVYSSQSKAFNIDKTNDLNHNTLALLSSPQAEWFDDPRSFALQVDKVKACKNKNSNFNSVNSDGCVDDTTTECNVPTLRKVIVPISAVESTKQSRKMCKEYTEVCIIENEKEYNKLLLRNGIGEGPRVFKENKTLPFEANTDFLKGVSFHKGCYVGQELTHRTHVMLVTRKRIVPIEFMTHTKDDKEKVHKHINQQEITDSTTSSSCAQIGEALYTRLAGHNDLEKVGEVTAVCENVGLGLIRLRYVDSVTRQIEPLQLQNGTQVQMSIPHWWPEKKIRKLLKPSDANKEGMKEIVDNIHKND